jgi:hypothetical protein
MATSEKVQANSKLKNDVIRLMFGSVSCMTAATCTNPMDVIKVRFQMQGEMGQSTTQKAYNNFFRAAYTIA